MLGTTSGKQGINLISKTPFCNNYNSKVCIMWQSCGVYLF